MLTLNNSLDLLYFILAIAAVWIGVMLTWLLFEAALMAHRANKVVKGTIEKVKRVEDAIFSIKDKLSSSAGYLNIVGEGAKMVMGMMAKKAKKRRRKEEEEEAEDE